MTISWMPVLPLWAIAAIVLALLVLLLHGSMVLAKKRLPLPWIATLGVLRVAIVLVFGICMLQPIISFRRTVEEGTPLLVLLDVSKSMGIKDAAAPAGRLPDALQWLGNSGLQSSLAGRANVHWFAFDSHARTVNAGDAASLATNGASTRYAESLSDAWELYRQQRSEGAPVVPGGRVLLVSDGHDSGARDIAEVARELFLTVDTLAPASAPPDAAAQRVDIAHVQAPRRVLLGAESRFAVALRQEGLAGKTLTLELKEGEKPVATQPFAFAAGEREKTVGIAFRPEEAGLKEYTIGIAGAGKLDAARVENAGGDGGAPSRKFSVQVVGARNEVLFIEDSWRWEFKFLRRIFEDDPSFTLTAFLSRGQNAFVQLGEPERRTQVAGFPQTHAELAGFDTFVLGSADPRRWPRGFPESLRQLVEEDGKSVIVIGGPNLSEMMKHPAIAELLPVELSPESATPVTGPVAVRVTADGMAAPFFAMPGGVPAAFWSSLPPVDQIYPALRKKPAASVLAESAQLGNSYGRFILMAEHTVGRGRVLFIGTDTLWKWQMLATTTEGPTPYQVFWQQALRALAPIRQSAGNVGLFIEPDRSRHEPGQTVVLRAEVRSERPLVKPRVQAQVTLPDGKQLPLDFSPDTNAPGIFTARFAAAMPGQHKVAATVVADDKTAADVLIAFDVEENTAELSAQHINEANLARIARDTGGQRIDRANPATWKSLAALEKVPVTRTETVDLWNRFALIIVLVLLLGADWLLRLLRGFA